MRVLFLLTTVGSTVKAHHATGFLSSVLKKGGHETDFAELNRVSGSLLDKEIARFKPDVLAASSVMQQMPYTSFYINYSKKKYPHIKTVLGGTHPILKPQCIEEIPGLDALCISEGEMPLLWYVNSIQEGKPRFDIPSMRFRVGGEIITNPNTYAMSEEDMAEFPLQDRLVFPRYRNADPNKPLGWNPRVLWSRGCPYACSYCAVPSIRKIFREPLKASKTKYIRYPPVDRCIEEIEMLADRWKFDTYIIDDDVFTTRKDWILEFAHKYPEHLKKRVKYEANLRVESVDKEIMIALKETGCNLLKFGLENGDYHLRKKILKRPITDDMIEEIFSWAHEVKIPAHTFNIIGIPGETKETVWKTIKLNRKIKPARVQITIFFPYYGTPLGDEARDQGMVVKETDSYFSGAAVKLDTLTSKQIEFYASWFKFLVYMTYNPKLAWQQLWGKTWVRVIGKLKAELRKLRAQKPLPRKLQVETLGSDGEMPEVLPQYDIEDFDKDFLEVNAEAKTQAKNQSESRC